jgi:hypothetical protein
MREYGGALSPCMTHTVIDNPPAALRPQALSQGLGSTIILRRIDGRQVLLLATDIMQVLLQIDQEEAHT